jgi:CHAT domain
MRSCPAPNGSLLPAGHGAVLGRIVQSLDGAGFRESRIKPQLPALIGALDAACRSDDDLQAWCDELRLWVRWYRVPAYWLTFVFQLFTQSRGSTWHFLACDLYADAQASFADDLAVASLETAYVGYVHNASALGPSFEPLGRAIRERLGDVLQMQATWLRPFEYREANPLADHHAFALAHMELCAQAVAANLPLDGDVATRGEHLAALIAGAGGDDGAWTRIVARRELALLHAQHDRAADSAAQSALALAEARSYQLDTEIGHLYRLHGAALRRLGRLAESQHHFEQALAYERLEPASIYTFYWQALSAYELGDTVVRQAGPPDDAPLDAPEDAVVACSDLEKMRPALTAYHDGRMHLSAHLAVQSPFPMARAAKQQLFRSFSANAIQVAAMLQSPADVLAEVEANGPREATELVALITAARDLSATEIVDLRRQRARYFATLGTAPTCFDDYLAAIVRDHDDRRAYLRTLIALQGRLAPETQPDRLVERTLALRLPDSIFVFFHVGARASVMVVLDPSSGLAAPHALGFGERQLRAIHAEFEQVQAAASDATTKNAALERLLDRYAELLGPALEPYLQFFPGRQLKIFPRLQMNAVPFHAMRLQGRTLLEHCRSVSYGQTLGLFLENHATAEATTDTALRIVTGDRVPWYGLLLPPLRERLGAALREETQPAWPDLRAAIASHPARDTVFACHGDFDPANVGASALELSSRVDGAVSFQRLFEDLDLRGARCVVMGSCESGLTRTEVAAEYVGLPAAMLASGVRYVIGALWKIPQAATAVLVDRFLLASSKPGASVADALAQAQSELMALRRDELAAWASEAMGDHPARAGVLAELMAMDELPFAGPYHWASLQVVGDV